MVNPVVNTDGRAQTMPKSTVKDEEFPVLADREHCLLRPDMYVGSVEPEPVTYFKFAMTVVEPPTSAALGEPAAAAATADDASVVSDATDTAKRKRRPARKTEITATEETSGCSRQSCSACPPTIPVAPIITIRLP